MKLDLDDVVFETWPRPEGVSINMSVGVRARHKPTGLVAVSTERWRFSQNKEEALRELERLLDGK